MAGWEDVGPGDRADLVAARALGDPTQFWQLCDANGAFDADELEVAGPHGAGGAARGLPGSSEDIRCLGASRCRSCSGRSPSPRRRPTSSTPCRRCRSPRTPASARASSSASPSARSTALDRMLADRTLDPPTRMLLVVHIDGRPTVLSDGVITRHDVLESNDAGQSSLSITGVDVSQMMDLIDLSGLPLPMPAEARVLTLLAPFAAYGCVPLVIPSPLLFVPNPINKIPQVQGTAYAYVSRLADEVGYTFFVEPGPTPGMNIAYWGPDVRVGPAQPALTVELRRRRRTSSRCRSPSTASSRPCTSSPSTPSR